MDRETITLTMKEMRRLQMIDMALAERITNSKGSPAALSQRAAWDTFDTNMIGVITNIIGTSSSFANVFATPTLAALLIIFVEHPERHFMQRELVEQSGSALYLVQREFKRLERTGLISREPRGRQVEYYANIEHPGFAGLRYAILNNRSGATRSREHERQFR